MTARFEELKPPAGEVPATSVTVLEPLDPEDPWSIKIEDIADAEETGEVVAEFEELCRGGEIPPARAARIRAAIQAKAATFGEQVAA